MDERFYLLMEQFNALIYFELKAAKTKLSSDDEAKMIEAKKVLDANDFWIAK